MISVFFITRNGLHTYKNSARGSNAEVFRNRKDYFSINTPIIGDVDLKIMDMVARWPGSVHDTTIFKDSFVRERFENGEFAQFCVIVDTPAGLI